ncbi:hypothetical protein [Macrococcoides caseolyticum]|uniref:hypothetical protein n=1 Tax=Macrococcoides caseolyticum TaxID=69966 RepID=UPI000C34D024|nr:hypothetical protein [Macrococcus caseolyticus]PKE18512.1 hypothetical protein CW679_10660 [Macrococcus caseolyticus]PKF39908.1 hypothetical protein CW661_10965 [Macrococcus caseolyticus]
MNKNYELNIEELKKLAKYGGNDNGTPVQPQSDLVISAATITTVEASLAVSALSLSWSKLYSCTKNTKSCKRK